jgi:hypothetical protein
MLFPTPKRKNPHIMRMLMSRPGLSLGGSRILEADALAGYLASRPHTMFQHILTTHTTDLLSTLRASYATNIIDLVSVQLEYPELS